MKCRICKRTIEKNEIYRDDGKPGKLCKDCVEKQIEKNIVIYLDKGKK